MFEMYIILYIRSSFWASRRLLVSAEDLELLEALENRTDLTAARRRLESGRSARDVWLRARPAADPVL